MVYIGTPTYDGTIDTHTIAQISKTIAQQKGIWAPKDGSLLTFNCNRLWAEALNMQKKSKLRYFVMVHSDIRIHDDNWLPKLIELKNQHKLAFLSVVSPIKDSTGDSSTAYLSKGKLHRLSIKETEELPEVFTKHSLIEKYSLEDCVLFANTGLMICDLNATWCEKAYFDELNKIEKVNGEFVARVQPEDWFFTELIQKLGYTVGVTTAIEIEHIGKHKYSNKTK